AYACLLDWTPSSLTTLSTLYFSRREHAQNSHNAPHSLGHSTLRGDEHEFDARARPQWRTATRTWPPTN
uniref:Uncharacterized protein n=1 Tax=Aegilops tauschii subsp. strangulata TaxID=200361 RepID=A0A453MQ35_AEGTS